MYSKSTFPAYELLGINEGFHWSRWIHVLTLNIVKSWNISRCFPDACKSHEFGANGRSEIKLQNHFTVHNFVYLHITLSYQCDILLAFFVWPFFLVTLSLPFLCPSFPLFLLSQMKISNIMQTTHSCALQLECGDSYIWEESKL